MTLRIHAFSFVLGAVSWHVYLTYKAAQAKINEPTDATKEAAAQEQELPPKKKAFADASEESID